MYANVQSVLKVGLFRVADGSVAFFSYTDTGQMMRKIDFSGKNGEARQNCQAPFAKYIRVVGIMTSFTTIK